MLKLLVVDDEEIIRKGIIKKIIRLIDNVKIVGEAADGEQALVLVERTNPDIVLTDIKMPVIDGIMFIEKALEYSKHTKFVILSGYNDFKYAQRALRLGVCDYLLKPVNNEELVQVIREIERRITLEKQQTKFFNGLKKEISNNQILLKNSIFKELLESNDTNVVNKIPEAGYIFSFPYFTAVAIRIIDEKKGVFYDDIQLKKFAICNICEEVLSEAGNAVLIDNYKHEDFVYGFINHKTDIHILTYLLDKAVKKIEELLSIKIYFGAGRQYKSINDMANSHIESKKSILQKHIFSSTNVIYYKDYEFIKTNYYVLNEEKRNFIFSYLDDANEKGLKNLIRQFLNDINRMKIDYEKVVDVCIEILFVIINYLKKENYYSNTDLHEIKISSYFNTCISISDFQQLLNKRIESCCAFRKENDTCAGKKIVKQIIKRIEKEYFKNLKLNTFAKQYYLNQSYLSQLFSTETGVNFSTYISNLRIKKAKEFLKSTNFSTSKIGELVGYKERSYFSKVFEKHEKITPHKYRESLQK